MENTNQTRVSTDNANVSGQNTSTPTPNAFVPPSRGKRFCKWVAVHIFGIFYIILLIGLWVYIILNWDKCISMKFFDQFDGNNILFLVGIALVIAFFYDVEAKGFKFRRRKNKNMNMQFQNAAYAYNNNQASNPSAQVTNNENKEEDSDE